MRIKSDVVDTSARNGYSATKFMNIPEYTDFISDVSDEMDIGYEGFRRVSSAEAEEIIDDVESVDDVLAGFYVTLGYNSEENEIAMDSCGVRKDGYQSARIVGTSEEKNFEEYTKILEGKDWK